MHQMAAFAVKVLVLFASPSVEIEIPPPSGDSMGYVYCQAETDFSSDTVIGLVARPAQISVGPYTVLNQASCLTALAMSSLSSFSGTLHVLFHFSIFRF